MRNASTASGAGVREPSGNEPAGNLAGCSKRSAWKEDHRRLSNGELSYKKLALAMAHPVSRVWAGIGKGHLIITIMGPQGHFKSIKEAIRPHCKNVQNTLYEAPRPP